MLRFSANLSFLFTEIPFADRFAAAAASGFRGVEFIDFGGLPRQQIADLLESHSLKLVMFNTALGDWGKGDRGIAAIAGREAECRSVVFQAIDQAADLKCGLLHLMSGLRSRGAREQTLRDNLELLLPYAAQQNVCLLIEPLNSRDVPDYLFNTVGQVHEFIGSVNHPRLGLQFDLYHHRMMGGDVLASLEVYLGKAAHIQIANTPDRGEPDAGQIDYATALTSIDESDYQGWIGCEYRPRVGTREGLGWMERFQAKHASG
ncbi:MAG: TIM barrel protein [Planctomycetales bacterium]|nr:TIM barrel protein [Planctomycetales bacterium]